jgi:hypothetical protein
MAYSDDNGDTFSPYMEISGSNAELCRYQITGPAGECDEDQASSPVVDSTGRLIVAFENEQFNGANDGYRSQYLVVTVDPDTLAVSGPYMVSNRELYIESFLGRFDRVYEVRKARQRVQGRGGVVLDNSAHGV